MVQRWFSGQKPDFLILTLVGGLTVIAGLTEIVRSLVRILPNRDVPVTVDLAGVPHELLLDGTTTAEATEAVIRVSDLGPVPYLVVLGAAVLPVIILMVVAVCFTLLGRSFYRGDFFTRKNLAAINTAAAMISTGAVLIPSLEGTASNSALVSAGVGSGSTLAWMGVDTVMFLAGLLLAAVGYAFQRGARLQQDAEGLV